MQSVKELIKQAEATKVRLALQRKSLNHGEELLAKGKVLLAKGRKVLEERNGDKR